MAKKIVYEVSLNELEIALEDRKLCKDESYKLENSLLGGEKLRNELENLSKPDIDKSVHVNIKSHGIYLQADKDLKREGEKDFSFMVRIPFWGGGDIAHDEYLRISELAEKYSFDEFGNASIRLTTRQAIQFHRVKKNKIINLVRELIKLNRLTLNGCGDNTRNPVACPVKSDIFNATELANRIGAYFRLPVKEHLIVFDNEVSYKATGESFKYDRNGLPRKFKMGIAGYHIDEKTGQGYYCNCTDILSNDIGVAPVIKNNTLKGYQVYVGGGLGQKNGKVTLAVLGTPFVIFKTENDLIKGLDALVDIQQKYGDRENRHWARFKNVIIKKGLEKTNYKIEEIIYDKEKLEDVQQHGAECLREKIQSYDVPYKPAINIALGKLDKHIGEIKQSNDKYSYGLWIENGRISHSNNNIKKVVDKIIEEVKPQIRLTAYQNLLFTDLQKEEIKKIENILNEDNYQFPSEVRKASLACVGLPTCGLAVSDSERYFNPLLTELESLGISDIKGVSIGISGCERHCSRNVRNEISIEGKGYGYYQLKLMFGRKELNDVAQDIVYEGKKYLRQIHKDDMPSLINLLVKNYKENKREDEKEISVFHKRIGIEKIIELIRQDDELAHLLEKTYEPYIV